MYSTLPVLSIGLVSMLIVCKNVCIRFTEGCMFGRKSEKTVRYTYNKDEEKPVIRCSICTGEMVAGFKSISTGHFRDVMLVRNDRDIETFKARYGIDEVTKEY